jgi:UDP-3-O-[3-hydroxymyristoyl] glucosamine N-acyltransferase
MKGRSRVNATVRELAELVQGQVIGDGELLITDAGPLGTAGPGAITFVEDEKHAPLLQKSAAAAAVVLPGFPEARQTLIKVADPLMAFVAIFGHVRGRAEPAAAGIDARAVVHATASVGQGTSIAALAVVGEGSVIGARCRIHAGVVIGRNCRIADDVTIYPNAVLYDDTVLGARTIIHANAVLGADGFGYRQHNGRHVKVPQLGNVEIGDDVEIGACTTIDRGTFQATCIGAGTKIDNLVQIGHNSKLGRHNILVGQVGLAGSVTTGDYVVFAGQAGLVDHVHIGDGAIIGAQTGVTKNVAAGARMFGSPAIPIRDHLRFLAHMEKLPEMRRDLRIIKQRLGLTDDTEAA